MGIMQELIDLQDKLAQRSGYPGHLQRLEAEHWEGMYWKVCSQMTEMQKNLSEKIEAFAHEKFRCRDLQELNHWQAGRIMELEYLMSFVHVNAAGTGVYVEHSKLMKLMRFIKIINETEPQGLSSSRYLRK